MFSGILLINKPENITSSDTLNLIKRKFKIKKIGHAGTLDAFAGGLLIAGINEGTKLLPLFMAREKVYEALFILGKTTDTLDETGNVVYTHRGKNPELFDIENVLKTFIGEVMQIPPDFSAVKLNGKRASDIVRNGEPVNLAPKRVLIKDIIVERYAFPELLLKIKCSKGTYIRALARDLGELLGCGGYVKTLTRTEISPYKLDDAKVLTDILLSYDLESLVIPMMESLPFLDKVIVNESEKSMLRNGRAIEKNTNYRTGLAVAVFENQVVGLVDVVTEKDSIIVKPVRIIN